MKHNYNFQEFGIQIRPVEVSDAEFIVNLRTDPQLSYFIGDVDPDIEKQKSWIQGYYSKPNDYYFIIHSLKRNEPVGVVSLYDVNTDTKSAEWGRWVIKPGVMAAPASALLIYQFGFEVLNLESIFCRTLCENVKVVSFHDQVGAEKKSIQPKAIKVRSEHRDVYVHEITRAAWNKSKSLLTEYSKKAERFA